jgi:SH3-like domain-containing protein
MWMMAVALGGATGAHAAEKSAEKPAAQKPAPAKPAAKAAAPAKPAVQTEEMPALKGPPKETTAKIPAATASDEADADEAGDGGKDAKGSAAGLPIPRFVSLRTNPINLRTGPGVRYPVDWVYVRRHLPVEIIGEFDTWRQIRDPDGTEGWVHQSMISGKRAAIVTKEPRPLKRTGDDAADTIATLEQGVVVNLQRCPAGATYCRVEVNGLQGWLKRGQFWGVYPDETLQ